MWGGPMTYKKKIAVMQSMDVQDEVGNVDCVWSEIYHGWASVNGIGGRKYYEAAHTNTQNEMLFTVRWCKSLSNVRCTCSDDDPEFMISYNNRNYAVTHVDDFMESHRTLVFHAEEVRK